MGIIDETKPFSEMNDRQAVDAGLIRVVRLGSVADLVRRAPWCARCGQRPCGCGPASVGVGPKGAA